MSGVQARAPPSYQYWALEQDLNPLCSKITVIWPTLRSDMPRKEFHCTINYTVCVTNNDYYSLYD